MEAKAPQGTPDKQLADMLQTLLGERFHLRIHRESRDLSGLAIVPTKDGPKLQASAVTNDDRGPDFRMGQSYTGVGKIEIKRASMAEVANYLSSQLQRPVRDLTGANGRYDLDLDFTPEDAKGLAIVTVNGAPPPVSDSAISLYTSVKKLGLKLDPRKVPVEVIVVDQIERNPTEN
jgi:uncharacterized protein (TIGR03435 family)